MNPVKRPVSCFMKHLSNFVLRKPSPVHIVLLFSLIQIAAINVALSAVAQQETGAATEVEQNSLSVYFLEEETGEPAVGVEVQFNAVLGEQRVRKVIASDKNGLSKFSWEGNPAVNYLQFTASKPAFVPVHRGWTDDRRKVDLPEQVEIDLVKGSQMNGVVHDEAGEPIANAEVDISLYPLQAERTSYLFKAAKFQTDELGKWSWDCAPSQTERISVRVTHPDYIRGYSRENSLKKENVVTLKQGLKITGRVVDDNGKPIENASATFGTSIWGTSAPAALTDTDGRFELANCKTGQSAVTVHAKSFAPQLLKIDASQDLKPLEFQLQPGNTIHIKVVDPDGEPIENAHISADTWQELRTISLRTNADANGEFVWKDAPPEPVEFDILKSGYIANRNVLLSPGDDPQVVTLYPKLVITGSVKESESGDPVDSFQIIRGSKFKNNSYISWSNDAPVEFTNGRYEFTFDEPRKEYYLKAIGRGYEAKISRAFTSDEGVVQYDFALDDGWSIKGVLRKPDGTSVSNMRVFYVLQHSSLIRLTNGLIGGQERGAAVATTDRTGRFTILPTGKKDDRFLLIASSDEGIATYKFIGAGWDEPTEFNPKKILTLELEPWGKLSGTVFTKGQPAASQKLTFYPRNFYSQRVNSFPIGITCSTTSDGEGKYQFARLPAGKGAVAKTVIEPLSIGGRSLSMSKSCWQTPVKIVAEETALIDIAKSGVVVKGSVTTDKKPDFEIDWTLNRKAKINRLPPSLTLEYLAEAAKAKLEVVGNADASSQSFLAMGPIDNDGNFEVPDVPPGIYKLTVILSQNNLPGSNQRSAVGKATVTFTVEKDQTEPLELGKVVVKIFDEP